MENNIICALLGCGYMDVNTLTSALRTYDNYVALDEVVDELKDNGLEIDFNTVLTGIYEAAYEGAWNDALEEYNENRSKEYVPKDRYTMMDFRDSYVTIWTNYMDSSISITDTKEIPSSEYPKKFVKILREKLDIA